MKTHTTNTAHIVLNSVYSEVSMITIHATNTAHTVLNSVYYSEVSMIAICIIVDWLCRGSLSSQKEGRR